MSAHFSKFMLNTYCGTPYFEAHVPSDYPLDRVLQRCRAFRRLPPRLRKLSALAKSWAQRSYPDADFGGINRWYDGDGYELDPGSGRRLTDEEIDNDWIPWEKPDIVVKDIPLPEGGFPDPDTWEEPPKEEEVELVDRGGMTEADILSWISSHGFKRVADEFGVPDRWIPHSGSDRTDLRANKELARIILDMHGKPWPGN